MIYGLHRKLSIFIAYFRYSFKFHFKFRHKIKFQVIRALVSPGNSGQVSSPCQQIMNSCGLLQALCTILMGSGVPADILTETINTVAEVIRGSFNNQEYFASVTAPSLPSRYSSSSRKFNFYNTL